uniref:Glycosyltransferase n=1 Tax=Fervidobacterium pennivorans TaxID=93466 RepID=A0A7V4NG58_FERPE
MFLVLRNKRSYTERFLKLICDFRMLMFDKSSSAVTYEEVIAMKRILVVLPKIPYPRTSGYSIKNLELMRILGKRYKITAAIVADSEPTNEAIAELKQYCQEVIVFRNKKIRVFGNILLALFNGQPFEVAYCYSSELRHYIELNGQTFDAGIFVVSRTAQYSVYFAGPKILDMGDFYGIRFSQIAENTRSLILKMIYTIESRRMLRFEKSIVGTADLSFLFNKFEAEELGKFGRVIHIPHGVNPKLFDYTELDARFSNVVSFIGKMDYGPNIEAALWFAQNVLPKLHKDIVFYVIGANPVRKIANLEKREPRIKVFGFVEDPYNVLRSSCCTVAPMQTAVGIQNKVLESMALGSIVVLTRKAAKTIGGIDGEHFLIADTPEQMADIINDVYLNPEKYEKLRMNAREFIKNKFTWEEFEKIYIRELENILNSRKSG